MVLHVNVEMLEILIDGAIISSYQLLHDLNLCLEPFPIFNLAARNLFDSSSLTGLVMSC